MKTFRTISSSIALLTLSLLLIVSFLSCGNQQNNVQSTDGSDVETQAPETEPELVIKLVEDQKCAYKVIFPAENTACMKMAEKLCSGIKNKFGVRPESGTDFLLPGREPGQYEILIGNTSRDESQQVYKKLTYGEFAIEIIGQKIVICGYNDESTEYAFAYFCQTVYTSANAKGEFSQSDCTSNSVNHKLEDLTVCSNKVSDMKICIEKYCGTAEYFAGLLQEKIEKLVGKTLEITTDATEEPAIRFGNFENGPKAEKDSYLIYADSKGLWVCASELAGLEDAYNALVKHIITSDRKEMTITNGQKWQGKLTNICSSEKIVGNIRVMYHNVWGYQSEYPILGRADMALDVYKDYSPDILCFEEAGNLYREGANGFYKSLDKLGYKEIVFKDEGGTGNPIYYRTSLFELVDSGYTRCRGGDKGTTWAIFKIKTGESAGKLFGVTNSHFAANSNANNDSALGNQYRIADAEDCVRIANEIAQKYSVSVIMGGDYNSAAGSDPISAISSGGAVNIRKLLDCWDIQSPFHSSFSYSNNRYELQTALNRSGTSSIDHIYLLGSEILPVKYEVVTNHMALTCSDHAPHFADIKVK